MLKIANQVTEECGIIRKRRHAQLTPKGGTAENLVYTPDVIVFCYRDETQKS